LSAQGPVLVSGATGLIGQRLLGALAREGAPVRALTRWPERSGERLQSAAEVMGWDGLEFHPAHLEGTGAAVHLAGEPIFAIRMTASHRRRIKTSRVDSTRSLVRALEALPAPARPGVLVCASAVGFYGSRGDERLDEESDSGQGFLPEVCHQWEAAARDAERCGLRVVLLRLGVVLAREGGALPLMARPFRLGLGARLGNGRQWFPWIHADDAVGLVRAALRDPALRGPLNAVGPEPVRNEQLTRSLALALGRQAFLAVPAFALRLALGELSDELLGSRRVVPALALRRGFPFAYRTLRAALEAELGDKRAER